MRGTVAAVVFVEWLSAEVARECSASCVGSVCMGSAVEWRGAGVGGVLGGAESAMERLVALWLLWLRSVMYVE